MFNKSKVVAPVLFTVALLASFSAFACTRFVYKGADNSIITGRSMDWKDDIGTNLWIFPRGMDRSGAAGPNSITWTSKYGSVIASGYDVSTTDGMNEKGLVANVLWLAESVYPKYDGKEKGLSISVWGQYALDNFSTVDEAVKALEKQPFIPITAAVPGQDRMATVHLSLSDPTGDSAIIEYVNGKQVIHHGAQYQVLTNSPIFEQQLALNEYWTQIGGLVMLPGTNRASDRFARASFYVDALPKTGTRNELLASVFGVIRNVSVPYGISTPNEPNISSTRWRSVSDQTNRVYFFESSFTPNTFWVELDKLDFSKETGKVKRLELGPNQDHVYSGAVNDKFVEHAAFTFLGQ